MEKKRAELDRGRWESTQNVKDKSKHAVKTIGEPVGASAGEHRRKKSPREGKNW